MTTVERWNLHLRAQHILLFLSMFVLIGTGLPLRYSYSGWALAVSNFAGGPLRLVALHKAGAVALALVGVYHLFYMFGRFGTGRATWAMVPTWKDVKDAWCHAMYLLGLRNKQAECDRYTYLEKFEYLAVFWGMVVMGLSGIALWFPLRASAWLPGWGLQVSRIIHSNEALVAVISITMGHFFFVIMHPRIFPFSKVWVTGRIDARQLAHEHPLEYERLVEEGRLQADAVHHEVEPLSPARRALAVAELVLYSAVFYILVTTFVPLLFV